MHVRRTLIMSSVALLALALAPGTALGHSELVSSSPANGALLEEPPAEVGGDYSEAVDPGRSSMELRGPDGSVIATGGVPAGGPATSMAIVSLPALAPGVYEVRWTTVTPDDGGVERGTFSFTVAPAGGTPSATPVAATPAPVATPGPAPAPGVATGDLALPLVLLAVLGVGAAWLLLRRR